MLVTRRGWLSAGMALFAAAPHALAAEQLVRVANATPVIFNFVPADVGVEAGIFEKHGIHVEIADVGARAQTAVIAGSADLELGAGPELIFAAKGAPTIGIAAIVDAPRSLVLIARTPIKTVADLKGKTAGVTVRGSVTEWMVKEVSRQQGWGSDGITTVDLGSNEAAVAALRVGQIDSMITDIAVAARLDAAGATHTLLSMDEVVKNFIMHVVFASRPFVAAHPDATRAFLAGWFDAVDYMRTHRDEAIRIAQKRMGAPYAIVAKSYDTLMPFYSKDGRFPPAGLATLAHSFVETGELHAEPDMSKITTEAYLPSAPAH